MMGSVLGVHLIHPTLGEVEPKSTKLHTQDWFTAPTWLRFYPDKKLFSANTSVIEKPIVDWIGMQILLRFDNQKSKQNLFPEELK